jgi:hypothetical protein
MSAVDSDTVYEFASLLDGRLTAPREARLEALLAETSDPAPIDLFEVWVDGKGLTTEEAVRRSAGRTMDDADSGFDPEEDPAYNTTRARVRSVYNRALEAGLDEEAEYLRELALERQQSFARLLDRGGFLSGGGDDE